MCLDAGKTVLVSRPGRAFTYFNEVEPPIVEALIVPVFDRSRIALGTIWVVHHNNEGFDGTDARLLEQLAVQLALALTLTRDATTHDQEIAGKLALIQDTDHRVKNTLQSVASLLQLQGRSTNVPEVRAALEEACSRLAVFSTVHELLHSKRDDSRAVDIGEIIEALAGALRASRPAGGERISLRVQADSILVEPRIALPVSLLVNEAITNAYKHAYPNHQAGEIFVRVAHNTGGGMRIGIQDDGIGFRPDTKENLGMTLIRSFASQLNGELLIQTEDGTSIHLVVPEATAPHVSPTPDRFQA